MKTFIHEWVPFLLAMAIIIIISILAS